MIHKTSFQISKMDCPSEEQMIRMKLADIKGIHSMEFDIPNRKLTVIHADHYDPILQKLNSLNFGTSLFETVPIESYTNTSNQKCEEKKLLLIVFIINLFFFGLEMFTGFLSNSMGLVADSLDMLADSFVYGLALVAVGGSMIRKKRIAKMAGYLQFSLAILGFFEVIRRFIGLDSVPNFETMIWVSFLALLGNSISLFLLQKSKNKEAHMQASMIFTSNDVIVNIGVILAAGLVYLTQSKYPDLIIGALVFVLVIKGAFKILKLSK